MQGKLTIAFEVDAIPEKERQALVMAFQERSVVAVTVGEFRLSVVFRGLAGSRSVYGVQLSLEGVIVAS